MEERLEVAKIRNAQLFTNKNCGRFQKKHIPVFYYLVLVWKESFHGNLKMQSRKGEAINRDASPRRLGLLEVLPGNRNNNMGNSLSIFIDFKSFHLFTVVSDSLHIQRLVKHSPSIHIPKHPLPALPPASCALRGRRLL